ncbi:hypothetical protein [Grapevine virus I]|uniref:Uncharacterized protein n=1 Tax=Grapevine virus I TaxID=2052157 RepID=A0A2K8JHI8_9VIRU|nr:hypothetical protein [Grapevine virus I]ATS17351.1 hypothetical protein [Grapevine virus I]
MMNEDEVATYLANRLGSQCSLESVCEWYNRWLLDAVHPPLGFYVVVSFFGDESVSENLINYLNLLARVQGKELVRFTTQQVQRSESKFYSANIRLVKELFITNNFSNPNLVEFYKLLGSCYLDSCYISTGLGGTTLKSSTLNSIKLDLTLDDIKGVLKRLTGTVAVI